MVAASSSDSAFEGLPKYTRAAASTPYAPWPRFIWLQ